MTTAAASSPSENGYENPEDYENYYYPEGDAIDFPFPKRLRRWCRQTVAFIIVVSSKAQVVWFITWRNLFAQHDDGVVETFAVVTLLKSRHKIVLRDKV